MTPDEEWRIQFGDSRGLYVGASVEDKTTGMRGQIKQILGDGWVEIRLPDGETVRVRFRPG